MDNQSAADNRKRRRYEMNSYPRHPRKSAAKCLGDCVRPDVFDPLSFLRLSDEIYVGQFISDQDDDRRATERVSF